MANGFKFGGDSGGQGTGTQSFGQKKFGSIYFGKGGGFGQTPIVNFNELEGERRNIYGDAYTERRQKFEQDNPDNLTEEEIDNFCQLYAQDKLFTWDQENRYPGLGEVGGRDQWLSQWKPTIQFDKLQGDERKVYGDAYTAKRQELEKNNNGFLGTGLFKMSEKEIDEKAQQAAEDALKAGVYGDPRENMYENALTEQLGRFGLTMDDYNAFPDDMKADLKNTFELSKQPTQDLFNFLQASPLVQEAMQRNADAETAVENQREYDQLLKSYNQDRKLLPAVGEQYQEFGPEYDEESMDVMRQALQKLDDRRKAWSERYDLAEDYYQQTGVTESELEGALEYAKNPERRRDEQAVNALFDESNPENADFVYAMKTIGMTREEYLNMPEEDRQGLLAAYKNGLEALQDWHVNERKEYEVTPQNAVNVDDIIREGGQPYRDKMQKLEQLNTLIELLENNINVGEKAFDPLMAGLVYQGKKWFQNNPALLEELKNQRDDLLGVASPEQREANRRAEAHADLVKKYEALGKTEADAEAEAMKRNAMEKRTTSYRLTDGAFVDALASIGVTRNQYERMMDWPRQKLIEAYNEGPEALRALGEEYGNSGEEMIRLNGGDRQPLTADDVMQEAIDDYNEANRPDERYRVAKENEAKAKEKLDSLNPLDPDYDQLHEQYKKEYEEAVAASQAAYKGTSGYNWQHLPETALHFGAGVIDMMSAGLYSNFESYAAAVRDLTELAHIDDLVKSIAKWNAKSILGVELSDEVLPDNPSAVWTENPFINWTRDRVEALKSGAQKLAEEKVIPEVADFIRGFSSTMDEKTATDAARTFVEKVAYSGSENFGHMLPQYAFMMAKGPEYLNSLQSLDGAKVFSRFWKSTVNAIKTPGFTALWADELGRYYMDQKAALGDKMTDWDRALALPESFWSSVIEFRDTSLGGQMHTRIFGTTSSTLKDFLRTGLNETSEEVRQMVTQEVFENFGDMLSGRTLRHQLDDNDYEDLFYLGKYLDLSVETGLSTTGMTMLTGMTGNAINRYSNAVQAMRNGTATQEQQDDVLRLALAEDMLEQAQDAAEHAPTEGDQHTAFAQGLGETAGQQNGRTPAAAAETVAAPEAAQTVAPEVAAANREEIIGALRRFGVDELTLQNISENFDNLDITPEKILEMQRAQEDQQKQEQQENELTFWAQDPELLNERMAEITEENEEIRKQREAEDAELKQIRERQEQEAQQQRMLAAEQAAQQRTAQQVEQDQALQAKLRQDEENRAREEQAARAAQEAEAQRLHEQAQQKEENIQAQKAQEDEQAAAEQTAQAEQRADQEQYAQDQADKVAALEQGQAQDAEEIARLEAEYKRTAGMIRDLKTAEDIYWSQLEYAFGPENINKVKDWVNRRRTGSESELAELEKDKEEVLYPIFDRAYQDGKIGQEDLNRIINNIYNAQDQIENNKFKLDDIRKEVNKYHRRYQAQKAAEDRAAQHNRDKEAGIQEQKAREDEQAALDMERRADQERYAQDQADKATAIETDWSTSGLKDESALNENGTEKAPETEEIKKKKEKLQKAEEELEEDDKKTDEYRTRINRLSEYLQNEIGESESANELLRLLEQYEHADNETKKELDKEIKKTLKNLSKETGVSNGDLSRLVEDNKAARQEYNKYFDDTNIYYGLLRYDANMLRREIGELEEAELEKAKEKSTSGLEVEQAAQTPETQQTEPWSTSGLEENPAIQTPETPAEEAAETGENPATVPPETREEEPAAETDETEAQPQEEQGETQQPETQKEEEEAGETGENQATTPPETREEEPAPETDETEAQRQEEQGETQQPETQEEEDEAGETAGQEEAAAPQPQNTNNPGEGDAAGEQAPAEGQTAENPATDTPEAETPAAETPEAAETDENQETQPTPEATQPQGEETDEQKRENGRKVARNFGFNYLERNGTPRAGVNIRSWSSSSSSHTASQVSYKRSGRTAMIDMADLKAIDEYAKARGIAVVVDDTIDNSTKNGYYKQTPGNPFTVHIAQDAENPLRTVFGHELYHAIVANNPQAAKQMQQAWLSYAQRAGLDMAAETQKIADLYERAGLQVPPAAVLQEEVIANSLYDVIGDQRTMQALAAQNRGMVQQIRNWVSKVMADIRSIVSRYAERDAGARMLRDTAGAMENMQRMIDEALSKTEAVDHSKKAVKSLGENGPMTKRYQDRMEKAENRQDANRATRQLAQDLLRRMGLEASAENVQKMLNAAQDFAASGGAMSNALRRAGFQGVSMDAEMNRAFGMLAKYMDSIMGRDTNGYMELMKGEPETAQEQQKPREPAVRKLKRGDDVKLSLKDRGQDSVEKRNDTGYNEANAEKGEQENDERRAERIRRRVREITQGSTSWALTGRAAVSIGRGDYSGIIKRGQKGYELFEAALSDSEIKSKRGYPLIWYHGTDAEFSRFERQKNANYNHTAGFYFTESAEVADYYSRENTNKKHIYPVGVYSRRNLEFKASEFDDNYRVQNEALKVIEKANKYAQKGIDEKFLTSLNKYLGHLVKERVLSDTVAGKIMDAFATKGAIDSVTVKAATWDYDGQRDPNDQIIVFDSENIIPATAEFWSKMADDENGTRYSLKTQQMDDEYMAAVESGDMETAQEMVDRAAEQQMKDSVIRDEDGKLMMVYHGTDQSFTVFDPSKGRANMDIQGMFFSPWAEDAEGYGPNVGRYYLNIRNPATESEGYRALNRFKGQNGAGIKARKYLESLGYDGLNNEDMEFVAFYPEQIKSADPVTYDDQGKVIPLSERFNPSEEDIRWSMKAGDSISQLTRDLDKTRDADVTLQTARALTARLLEANDTDVNAMTRGQLLSAAMAYTASEDVGQAMEGSDLNIQLTKQQDVSALRAIGDAAVRLMEQDPEMYEALFTEETPEEAKERKKAARAQAKARTADEVADAWQVRADYAGTDQNAHELIVDLVDAITNIRTKATMDQDGRVVRQTGHWKSAVPTLAKAVQQSLGITMPEETVKKAVREALTNMDEELARGVHPETALDNCLNMTLASLTDLYMAELNKNSDRAQITKDALNLIRDKVGSLVLMPTERSEVEAAAEDGLKGFRKVMSGVVDVRVARINKETGNAVHTTGQSIEDVYKDEDVVRALGLDPELSNPGDQIMDLYEKVKALKTPVGRAAITTEETDMLHKVALNLVASYFTSGENTTVATSTEVVSDERHQEVLRQAEELEKEVSEKQDELMMAQSELSALEEKYNAVVQNSQNLYNTLMQERKANVPAAQLEDLRNQMLEAQQNEAQAQKDLKAAEKKLKDLQKKQTERQQKLRNLQKQLRAQEKLNEKQQRQMDRMLGRIDKLKVNILAEKQKVQDARARAKAQKERTESMERIRKKGTILRKMLAQPGKLGYVQQEYVRTVADFVQALSDNDGRKSAEMGKRLRDMVYDAQTSQDYAVQNLFDGGLSDMVDASIKALDTKGALRNLSDQEMTLVENTVASMVTVLSNMNKFLNAKMQMEAQDASAEGIRVLERNRRTHSGAKGALNKLILQHLNGERVFEMLAHHEDNVIRQAGEGFTEGYRKAGIVKMNMTKPFVPLTTGENAKKFDRFTGKNATWYKTDVEILDTHGQETGRTMELTGAMRVSLWFDVNYEENLEAMRAGKVNGMDLYQLTLPDKQLMQKGKVKEAYQEGERVYFTLNQAKEILDEMTDYEKAWVKAYQEMEAYSKEQINATSLKLKGFRLASVRHYFPIRRDTNFIATNFESVVVDNMLEHQGWTKARVDAHNPMLLTDVAQIVNSQIQGVSDYVGYAIPIRDFMLLYNTTLGGYSDSVKAAISRTQGSDVTKYIEDLIGDLQGEHRMENTWIDNLRGKAAAATLTLNVGVMTKQMASYPAAAAVVGWSPLLKAMGSFVNRKNIDPNGYREIYTSGYWERQNLKLSDMEANANRNTALKKGLHKIGNGIQAFDLLTTDVLWQAAKIYVEDTTGLRPGTEEEIKSGKDPYYQKVAEVYNQMLEQSQPEYNVWQRPAILRSRSGGVKFFTMYKTQSIQNFGLVVDAFGQLNDARENLKANDNEETRAAYEQAKRQVAKTVSSQVVSAVMLAVLTMLGKAIFHRMKDYKDEKGDITAASAGKQIAKDTASSVAGMVVGGSELFDLIVGLMEGKAPYDIEAAGISTINDLYQNTYSLFSGAQVIGDSDLTPEEKMQKLTPKMRKFAGSLAQLLGIPLDNAVKLVDGIATNAKEFALGKPLTFEEGGFLGTAQGRETSNADVAGYIAQAMMSGDTAEAERLYNGQLAQGKTPEAINTAIANWQKANIPEIRQAAEAIEIDGDIDLYNRLIKEITQKGISTANAVKYVESERQKIKKAEKAEKEAQEQKEAQTAAGPQRMTYEQITAGMTKEASEQLYTNGMMNSLLEDGNVEQAVAVKNAMLEGGKKQSSINSSLSNYWKPLLLEAYEAGDMMEVKRITDMLVSMGMNRSTIQGWTSTKSSGSAKKSSFGRSSFGSSSFGKSAFGSGTFGSGSFGKTAGKKSSKKKWSSKSF